MAKGADYYAAYEKSLTERQTLDQTYKDCFDYTYPIMGAGLQGTSTESTSVIQDATGAKVVKNYDSTAAESCRLLASAIIAGFTPANSQWFLMQVLGRRTATAQLAGHRWLDETAKSIWQAIHDGNYDSVGMQVFLTWAIGGWSPMYVDQDEDGGIRCESWPMAECTLGQSRKDGPADIVRRKFKMSARQAAEQYGYANLPTSVQSDFKSDPDKQSEYLWIIQPRLDGIVGAKTGKAMPIASVTIECSSKKIVRESGYREHPVMVPRWLPLPNSAYAVGPMYEALADTKTLNQLVQFVLMNAELAVAGMWIAEDDGVLNPRTIKIGPRKVVVANSVDSMKPLSPAAKFDVAFVMKEGLETKIRRMLLADQLQLPNNDRMTATEIEARLSQLRNMLAPILGRLQSEFLQPFIARVFSLLLHSGQIEPPPPEIVAGGTINIRYVSPLARQQRAVEVQTIDRFESDLLQTAEGTQDPSIMDIYDWEAGKREKALLSGLPLKLLRTNAQVKTIRDARNRQQAAALAAQQNEANAGAAADRLLARAA